MDKEKLKLWTMTALFILFGGLPMILSFCWQHVLAGWALGAYWFNPNAFIRQYQIKPVWWPGDRSKKS